MKTWNVSASIAVLLLTLAGGVFLGYRLFSPRPPVQPQVTAQVILTALKDRGFLVTQTYLFDEPVTIKKTTGSAFKDFFFGQTITARGVMEVNLGIDLAKVSGDDVKIEDDNVVVAIPPAGTFNVRLVGPIDVKNDQGLLKRILQNDDGYNEALAELSKAAEEAAKKPELLSRADDKAVEEITRLLGYVARGKTVQVVVR